MSLSVAYLCLRVPVGKGRLGAPFKALAQSVKTRSAQKWVTLLRFLFCNIINQH